MEEEAKYWSKDYTNEHIREQIKENSQMFSLIIGILGGFGNHSFGDKLDASFNVVW